MRPMPCNALPALEVKTTNRHSGWDTQSSGVAPMSIIFLRIGWMERYRGLVGDTVAGGGAHVDEYGYGVEIFNFQPFKGSVYGFVWPSRLRNLPKDRIPNININRLGAAGTDDHVAGVLAVWVARDLKETGSYIVGWYANATVYRKCQAPPPGANRHNAISDKNIGYNVTALVSNAVLLPPDERLFRVPNATKEPFGIGQSNIWYADKDRDEVRQFRQRVREYTEIRSLPAPPDVGDDPPRQPDPSRRQEVERIAVERVTAHYKKAGYTVVSFEQDNVGWDLDAVRGHRRLRLEVKGLSGSETRFELTPNEYRNMQVHRSTYRICVVTEALTSPTLTVFCFVRDTGEWQDRDGRLLEINEVTAARCGVG